MSACGNSCQPWPGAGAILHARWTADLRLKDAWEGVLANPAAVPHLWTIFADCTFGSIAQGNDAEKEPFTVLTAAERKGRR